MFPAANSFAPWGRRHNPRRPPQPPNPTTRASFAHDHRISHSRTLLCGSAALVREGSASILFLRNADAQFRPLGQLAARDGEGDDDDDGCIASCVDWYGNARPIFLRGRTFALLGYELVEGALDDGRLREVRRVNFAPHPKEASAR